MTLCNRIAAEIQARIDSGVYRPGTKIPSIRQVAAEFDCNKATVHRAFERLAREGLIENTVGRGSFVRFAQKISPAKEWVDFRSDYIAESFFPYRAAQSIFSELFESEKSRALAPVPAQGEPELLKVLGAYYQVPTDRMLIISGAQQGLDLVAKVFGARISDCFLFEDPTYPMAISRFKARHFVPLEADGPQLEALDRKLSDPIKLFYAMPAVHNPTGITYSLQKRKALAERAERLPFYIVEDDYLSEFCPQPFPRFVDLLPQRTIYIKSLAQTTIAGLRLGFMIVPVDLYDQFLYAKYNSDITSSGLLQKFALRFVRDGGYRAYLAETLARLTQRKGRLLDLLKSYRRLSIALPQFGFCLWIKSQKVLNLPHRPWCGGEEFSFSPEFRNYFRISLLNMDEPAFESGLVYLRTLLDRVEAG
jgi:DNA-binding transcriptional MocR family regulator